MEEEEDELDDGLNKTRPKGEFNMPADQVAGTNRMMGHSRGIASMGMRSQ